MAAKKKVVVTRGGWRLWLMAPVLVAVPVFVVGFLFAGSPVIQEEIAYDFLETSDDNMAADFRFVDQNEVGDDLNEEPDGMPSVQTAVYKPAVKVERRSRPTQFVVERGKGLTSYVSYQEAIDIAANNGLKLYLGRRVRPGYETTPARARQLERLTDRLQVTVAVEPGDKFVRTDRGWRYFPASRRGRD